MGIEGRRKKGNERIEEQRVQRKRGSEGIREQQGV